MSGSCEVKRTKRNFNTDKVKQVRRDISDAEDLHIQSHQLRILNFQKRHYRGFIWQNRLKARQRTVSFALYELFRLCITKPDLSTLCFKGHKCNLHKLILHKKKIEKTQLKVFALRGFIFRDIHKKQGRSSSNSGYEIQKICGWKIYSRTRTFGVQVHKSNIRVKRWHNKYENSKLY